MGELTLVRLARQLHLLQHHERRGSTALHQKWLGMADASPCRHCKIMSENRMVEAESLGKSRPLAAAQRHRHRADRRHRAATGRICPAWSTGAAYTRYIAIAAARIMEKTTPVGGGADHSLRACPKHHMSLNGTITLDYATMYAVIRCVVTLGGAFTASKRVFVLNGHGGKHGTALART